VVRRKEETQRMQDEYDAYVSEHFRRGAMRQLSDDERHALIDGLKVYTRFARVPDESLGSFFEFSSTWKVLENDIDEKTFK